MHLRDAARGGAFALDLHAPACLSQGLFALGAGVAAIGIHVTAGIVGIEQCFEDSGVGDGGVGDGQSACELATLVDAGVQLVTEVVLAMLFCPARVDVFLMLAASASKSTCLVKPTGGPPINARRVSRSCSANRLIRGFIKKSWRANRKCQCGISI